MIPVYPARQECCGYFHRSGEPCPDPNDENWARDLADSLGYAAFAELDDYAIVNWETGC